MTIRERLERLERLDAPQRMIWLTLIWLLLLSILWVWWDERTLPDILGNWVGAGCEEFRSQDGVSHVKRSLHLGEGEWNLMIDFFGDTDCAHAQYGLDIRGPYDMGPKSMDTRGATTIRFDVGRTLLTPRTPDVAAQFDAAGCAGGNWQVGEAQEVTQLGCLNLVPTKEACPVEYDIVKIEDDALYLGDRSRGLCVTERYPKRFSPTPLHRFEPEP